MREKYRSQMIRISNGLQLLKFFLCVFIRDMYSFQRFFSGVEKGRGTYSYIPVHRP